MSKTNHIQNIINLFMLQSIITLENSENHAKLSWINVRPFRVSFDPKKKKNRGSSWQRLFHPGKKKKQLSIWWLYMKRRVLYVLIGEKKRGNYFEEVVGYKRYP